MFARKRISGFSVLIAKSDLVWQIKRMKYWKGSQSKYRLMYHLVWIPKYRKRVLKGRIASRISELLHECADMNRWKIEELKILPDHVHVLVQMRPEVSVSRMIQLFKGTSSRAIREEHPELKEFLWGKSFWADGYFAETCGQLNEQRVRDYIKNQ